MVERPAGRSRGWRGRCCWRRGTLGAVTPPVTRTPRRWWRGWRARWRRWGTRCMKGAALSSLPTAMSPSGGGSRRALGRRRAITTMRRLGRRATLATLGRRRGRGRGAEGGGLRGPPGRGGGKPGVGGAGGGGLFGFFGGGGGGGGGGLLQLC